MTEHLADDTTPAKTTDNLTQTTPKAPETTAPKTVEPTVPDQAAEEALGQEDLTITETALDEEIPQAVIETEQPLEENFGIKLLRDMLLPDILGQDNEILYWAGKHLARKQQISSLEILPYFFAKACFGELILTKQRKSSYVFKLKGPIVASRYKQEKDPEFKLEAGFLAATIERLSGFLTEAIIEKQSKHGVTIFVQTDLSRPASLIVE